MRFKVKEFTFCCPLLIVFCHFPSTCEAKRVWKLHFSCEETEGALKVHKTRGDFYSAPKKNALALEICFGRRLVQAIYAKRQKKSAATG